MAKKMIQEDFETEPVRNRIVRQDRFEVPDTETFLKIGEVTYGVLDYSTFGIRISLATNGNQGPGPGKDRCQGTLIFKGVESQKLTLRPVRGDQSIQVYEIIGEPLNIETLKGIESAIDVSENQTRLFRKRDAISEEFKAQIYEIKEWMLQLSDKCKEVEEALALRDPAFRDHFELAFSQTLSFYLQKTFPERHKKFFKLLDGLDSDLMNEHVDFFRGQLGQIINQAPFSHRAYTKPRGYAGDFEMMNQIYRNDFEGGSLFAKALHNYLTNEPAARAVRNRCYYLRDSIKKFILDWKGDKEINILSVASGPARELTLISEELSNVSTRVNFYCLDQDEESLKGAQREFRKHSQNSNFKLNLVNLALKNVIAKGLGEKKYDLIYSAGLFDYFSDPVAQLAAGRLFESVAPGGELIIGNFSYDNPTHPIMHMALDWNLIYRSRDDLRNLFDHVGGKFSIESEELGINLFCRILKQKG